MRTSFDLKILATTHEEAISDAKTLISEFLGMSEEDILDRVELEVKVSLPKADSAAEIAETMDNKQFVVNVFGTVKRAVTKPFGA